MYDCGILPDEVSTHVGVVVVAAEFLSWDTSMEFYCLLSNLHVNHGKTDHMSAREPILALVLTSAGTVRGGAVGMLITLYYKREGTRASICMAENTTLRNFE